MNTRIISKIWGLMMFLPFLAFSQNTIQGTGSPKALLDELQAKYDLIFKVKLYEFYTSLKFDL
jgi:hypothetical protein